MPDNDRVPIDSLTQIPEYDGSDVFPVVHDNNGTKSTYKGLLSGLATFINKLLHSSSDLHTQNDTIIGAINELADGGGGSTDIISEASGTIATFNDGGDNIPVKSLVTDITATQAGSGTPAPDNVRAITGVDAVNVNVIGKNFLPMFTGETTSGITFSVADDGVVTASGQASGNARIAQYLYLQAGTYILSGASSGSSSGIGDLYVTIISSGIVIARDYDGSAENTFTLTQTERLYIACRFSNGATSSSTTKVFYPQIERGETASEYNPYTRTSHTITLPETIYKGEADVVSGKGTKSFNAVDLGDLSYTYDSLNTRMVAVISDLKSTGTRRTSFVCSCFQTIDDGRELVNVPNNSVYSGNVGNTQVYIQTTDYTDPAAFKTAMVGQTLVYPIEDTDIVFAPVKIPTLSGLNNIYSSTGDVEVEYFNENADQTSELIDAKQEFVNYSSDEKVVGKWLDGSTLYEKTLLFNNKKLDKADNTSELVHGIENIGSIRFVAEVYFDFAGGQYGWSPANNGLWNNGVYNFYWVVGETSIYILSASGVYFDANPNRSYLVKIRYTKA